MEFFTRNKPYCLNIYYVTLTLLIINILLGKHRADNKQISITNIERVYKRHKKPHIGHIKLESFV